MDGQIELSYCIEDYKAAKAELLSTIDMQFKILSILVTATAAVFVYLFKKDPHQIVFSACLIIPGIYAFFGTLWLDQVYRQRRLAAYIYEIENISAFPHNRSVALSAGWEHFVQGNRRKQRLNKPSRYYYHICLGLFFAVPVGVFACACIYSKGGNVLSFSHELFAPALGGIILYLFFCFFSILYIRSINSLGDSFSGKKKSQFAKEALAKAEEIVKRVDDVGNTKKTNAVK